MAFFDATELPVTRVSRSSPPNLAGALTAASPAGNKVKNNGQTLIRLKVEGVAQSRQVTFVFSDTRSADGLPVSDRTYTINSSEDMLLGPFPESLNYAGSQYLYMSIGDDTVLTMAAYAAAPE